MQRLTDMNNYLKFVLLLCFLLFSVVISLGFGSIPIDPLVICRYFEKLITTGQFSDSMLDTILLTIRLPRTFFAIISGIGLSLAGLLMQTITRNYLADPYILGVSAGASTGAVCAIILGWFSILGAYNTSFAAFLGAMLATTLVILFTGRSSSPVKLILVGMGMSALFSAITMLVIYSAKHEAQVRSAMFWLLGSLSGMQWSDLFITAPVISLLLLFIWFLRHELDLVLFGETEAKQMGLPVKRLQLLVALVASLTVAVLVAKAGIIGFVGLITPHLTRVLVGPKHGVLGVFSSLIGAIVLLWSDILSRSIFRPEEIPIGVLTACLGAPLFIWMIGKKYEDE